ncbi:hypothetical protein CVIRNUC_003645 [Coccomyxa viridis]|uniref:Uncharacterized protein n=1 Tax=Coccomyxa viridis TaxID=1274662 RepID=A0AAV1I2Y6_9CHLO|nr:hypothetical protein CVIRNUC_003645 [Coccomyxa viridis]
MRDQRAGGLTDFWKKKVFPDDITAEEDAVQRIHGLAYVAKNKTAQGDIQYRVLEYARRYGAVSASVFGEVESRSNVLASLTSQNSPAKATDCSDEAKDGTASPYPELRSRKLQSMQARDYGLFMIGEARCQKGATVPAQNKDLLRGIVDRTPFFDGLDDFLSHFAARKTIPYIRRAQLYYVLAEYHSQLYFRAVGLYNVELMTLFTEIFDDTGLQGSTISDPSRSGRYASKLDQVNRTKKKLKEGDTGVSGLGASSGGLGTFAMTDPITGLSLDSPILKAAQRGGVGESKPLQAAAIARMVEMFMAEPTFKGWSISGSEGDAFNLKMHEPLTTTSMRRTGSTTTTPIYLDDIRSKFLLAMRETRKNLLLARYTKRMVQGRESTALMQKLQGDIDAKRVDRIEKGMDEVYSGAVKPLIKELDDRVYNNLAVASEKILRVKDPYRAPISPLLNPSFTLPSAMQQTKSAVSGSLDTPWF